MPEDVSPQGDHAKAAPDSPDKGGGAKGKDEAATLREEIAQLRKTNQQLTESERYWAERAQGRSDDDELDDESADDAPAPKQPAGDDDGEDLDDPKIFVDALAERGPKAIAQWLKKNGYVTAAEAEGLAQKTASQAVAKARQALAQDSELMSEFPELKDSESALFQETGKVYRAMVKRDPGLKKSPAALYQAAETAKLRLQVAAKAKAAPDEDQEPDDYRERDRRSRVAAQQGDRGRGRSSFEEDASDAIGPQAKEVMEALGVSEDEYKAEKKKMRAR